MKRLLAVIAVVLYVAVSAYSQSLTQADRDRAMKYLESTNQVRTVGRWRK
jgi:Tfp pilus assembly protein PilE